MASNTSKWNLGEIVYPPRTTKLLKSSSTDLYERLIDLSYICIREATEGQYGILLKVLGKVKANYIMFVNGQPFCKDDAVELFDGMSYFSYSFPTVAELKEVLDIFRSNPSLLNHFEAASMHLNPKSLFWVNEIVNDLLFIKKPQCYNASTESLSTASDHMAPYRITMVYFNTQLQIVEPVVVEPVATEPVMSEPVVAEPVVAEPVATEPVMSEPVATEPVVAEPVVAEPVVAEPEQKNSDGKWKKRVLPIIFCLAVLFIGGYLIGKYVSSQNEIDPENVEKTPVTDVKTPVKEIISAENEDSLSQAEGTVSQQEQKNDSISLDQYEAMDNRVRTGAYRIIGTDHIVIVKPNDDLTRICKRTIGRGMECYLEVYNGIASDSLLKPGQEIKIPKLELKKKKPQAQE